jgi:hypothetical protein
MTSFPLIYRLFYQIDKEISPRPGQSQVRQRASGKTQGAQSNRHFRSGLHFPASFLCFSDAPSFSSLEKYF